MAKNEMERRIDSIKFNQVIQTIVMITIFIVIVIIIRSVSIMMDDIITIMKILNHE